MTNVDDLTYRDPYRVDSYQSPYNVLGADNLKFANLDEVFRICSKDGGLPLAIVLPGNIAVDGSAVDALYLPVIVDVLNRVCGAISDPLNVELGITRYEHESQGATGSGAGAHVYTSWECDDRPEDRTADEVTDPQHLNDLEKLFPNHMRPKHDDFPDDVSFRDAQRRWALYIRKLLNGRQEAILANAKRVLGQRNLIVVGSSKVNQVFANLDHILLYNHDVFGKLGMYLVPPAGKLPMQLRRCCADGWREWSDYSWRDNNIGWVQMIRNPWSPLNAPRFLVSLGGFHDQGTQAAMWKLTDILETFLAVAKQENSPEQRRRALEQRHVDYQSGAITVPGHVVNAVVQYPLNWFWLTKRPVNKWTTSPYSIRGSIVGYEDVL